VVVGVQCFHHQTTFRDEEEGGGGASLEGWSIQEEGHKTMFAESDILYRWCEGNVRCPPLNGEGKQM